MTEYDPWALDEGFGAGADYTATIESITFASGLYGFQATVQNRYLEPLYKDNGEVSTGRPEFLSIGSNEEWEAIDSGRAFKHKAKEQAKVRANSQWGTFVAREVELFGADELRSRGTPFEAKTFEGLTQRWMTEGAGVAYSFTDKDSGEKKEGKSKGRNMPVEVAGVPGANGHSTVAFDLAELGLTATEISLLQGACEGKDLGTAAKFQAVILGCLPGLSGDSAAKVTNALGPKTAEAFQEALVGF